jgi:hypothetical protein
MNDESRLHAAGSPETTLTPDLVDSVASAAACRLAAIPILLDNSPEMHSQDGIQAILDDVIGNLSALATTAVRAAGADARASAGNGKPATTGQSPSVSAIENEVDKIESAYIGLGSLAQTLHCLGTTDGHEEDLRSTLPWLSAQITESINRLEEAGISIRRLAG